MHSKKSDSVIEETVASAIQLSTVLRQIKAYILIAFTLTASAVFVSIEVGLIASCANSVVDGLNVPTYASPYLADM